MFAELSINYIITLVVVLYILRPLLSGLSVLQVFEKARNGRTVTKGDLNLILAELDKNNEAIKKMSGRAYANKKTSDNDMIMQLLPMILGGAAPGAAPGGLDLAGLATQFLQSQNNNNLSNEVDINGKEGKG